jgi:hypothetical protein
MMPNVSAPRCAEPTAVEEVPAGEAAAIQRMIEELERQLTERYLQKGELVRRDAHPKILGLVRARFVVSPDCPLELRHGLFSEPGRAFKAEIRFSNGHPVMQHDLAFDVRGMAVKLPEVAGDFTEEPGHDFVMATAEAFFAINTVDYVDFPAASVSPLKTMWYFLRKFRRYRAGVRLIQSMTVPASPLDIGYFSQTPYRLGPHCVKFHARPVAVRSAGRDPWYTRPIVRHLLGAVATIGIPLPSWIPPDAVRRALIRDLAASAVTFELFVQRWSDLGNLPRWAIEDASKTWPAPWVKIATIEILRQCGIAERDAEAERMTFSPWHALQAHQPLGSINRARLAVYRTMSAFRNHHNPVGNASSAQVIVCPACDDAESSRAPDPSQ